MWYTLRLMFQLKNYLIMNLIHNTFYLNSLISLSLQYTCFHFWTNVKVVYLYVEAKDVCHIWELGGGILFTSVLENGHSLTSYGPLAVVLMLDLSELSQIWSSLDTLLDTIKSTWVRINPNITNETSQKVMKDHPVSNIVFGSIWSLNTVG